MLDLINLLIIAISGYGFYHTVQVLRGNKLNFKPFNCAICLSFWYGIIIMIFLTFQLQVIKILVSALFIVGIVDIIKQLIERRANNDSIGRI